VVRVGASSSTVAVSRWPWPVIVAGGAIMASLFPVYSTLHGPTSFYERGVWLGLEGQVWGGVMNGVPSLLIACGLVGARPVVVGHGRRGVRVGYVMVLVALLIPGVLDLALRAITPPLLLPVQAVGLLLIGLGSRQGRVLSATAGGALACIGTMLLLAFLVALVPIDVSDRYDGYRVFGLLAYAMVGVAWIVFGLSLTGSPSKAPREERPRTAPERMPVEPV
jgi:hypothetical protein